MQRVDGFYLYLTGTQIHPISGLGPFGDEAPMIREALYTIIVAIGALEPLVTQSIFKLRTSYAAGMTLLTTLKAVREKLEAEPDKAKRIEWNDSWPLTSALTKFEAILGAELSISPLYLVTQQAGYDTAILVEQGESCFPGELAQKVPEALPDLRQGAKCLAFDLHTAAGFHLHRANESVLKRYWNTVSQGAEPPNDRNMGTYLREMDNRNIGDPKVKAALRDLKDFHRNPLIHPEHSLESNHEAIALMNSIHNVMVQMLREIPGLPAPPTVGALSMTNPQQSS